MRARTIYSLAGCLGVAALTIGSTSAMSAANLRSPRAPTPEQQEFDHASDEANAAADAGDWDAALRYADEGLRALPERDATQAKRAGLMDLVGKFRLDDRNRTQLETSAAILRAYVDELERVHGTAVDEVEPWQDATSYLADIDRRLQDLSAPPPPPPPIIEGDEPARERPADEVRDRSKHALGMQIGGGVAIIVGGALTIVGGVFAARWRDEARVYSNLKRQNNFSPGSVAEEDEEAQYSAFTQARATALGVGLTGLAVLGVGVALVVLGTQRAGKTKNLALTSSGVCVRF